jgi:hypothetical protein
MKALNILTALCLITLGSSIAHAGATCTHQKHSDVRSVNANNTVSRVNHLLGRASESKPAPRTSASNATK